jgi:hypothetical protein
VLTSGVSEELSYLAGAGLDVDKGAGKVVVLPRGFFDAEVECRRLAVQWLYLSEWDWRWAPKAAPECRLVAT